MYRALYRKWRPNRFCDVIGQECSTEILESEVLSDKIGHAYLFIGPRGTGKTTCARIFSKAINCTNSESSEKPCFVCKNCTLAENETLQDIIELDAASNNGVNDIREICESTRFTPVVCKYKVYIIDEVHMLSTGAFNALLKTLEEPPDHVVFLLATTEVNKIPPTILSRCQKFEFRKISVEKIAERLIFVANNEKINLEKKAAVSIADCSDGAMRDALSILDKCASVSNDVTEELVCKTLMIVDEESVFKLLECIVNKNLKDAFVQLANVEFLSDSVSDLFSRLIFMFRDLMISKSGVDVRNITNLSGSLIDKIKKVSNNISLSSILSILDKLQEYAQKLPYALDKELLFQSALIKICEDQYPNSGIKQDVACERLQLENRLSVIENELKKVQSSKESLIPINEMQSEKRSVSNDDAVQTQKITSENLIKNAKKMENWSEVLEILKGTSRTVYSAFKGSSAYISDGYVLIDSPANLAFDLLKKSVQRDKIRDIIKKVTGRHYRLGPYKKLVGSEGVVGKVGTSLVGTGSNGSESDPLNVFINRARDLGIDVVLKGGD